MAIPFITAVREPLGPTTRALKGLELGTGRDGEGLLLGGGDELGELLLHALDLCGGGANRQAKAPL